MRLIYKKKSKQKKTPTTKIDPNADTLLIRIQKQGRIYASLTEIIHHKKQI